MPKIIESCYQAYLDKCTLKEADMSQAQKNGTKDAFYAGFSSCIVYMTEGISEHEEIGMQQLEGIHSEVIEYFSKR